MAKTPPLLKLFSPSSSSSSAPYSIPSSSSFPHPGCPIIGEEMVKDVAPFHYGPLGRQTSISLFEKETQMGSCIFRQRQADPTQHVLTIIYPHHDGPRLIHVLIFEKQGSFVLQNGESFPNLTAVLKHQEKRAQKEDKKFVALPRRKMKRKILPLTPWKYSTSKEKWIQCPSSSSSSFPPSLSSPSFPINGLREVSVVTFNVWFSRFEWEKRLESLLEILKEKNADFVCLQEVTLRFFGPLLQSEWIRENYYLSDNSDRHFGEFYGTLMLSKFPFEIIQRYQDLPTGQGRDFLAATFNVNGEIFTCSTVHLESCAPSFTLRKQQLNLIFDSLRSSDTALFMGDMNMAPSYPENNSVDPEYVDIWPCLRCPGGKQPHLDPSSSHSHPIEEDPPGFTEDTTINTMRYIHSGRRHRHVRYDRVFLRSKNWRATEIEILGREEVGGGEGEETAEGGIFPSDHFGLFSKFCWEGEL